jgi:hypothetical protein
VNLLLVYFANNPTATNEWLWIWLRFSAHSRWAFNQKVGRGMTSSSEENVKTSPRLCSKPSRQWLQRRLARAAAGLFSTGEKTLPAKEGY